MKQKVISTMLLLSMGATLLAGCGTTAGNGTEGGASNAAEGKVINIYSWNDEFRTRVEAVYPEVKETSKDGTITYLKDGTEIHWIVNPNQDGVYQQKLDEALSKQADAAADDKIDMFLSETDYVFKYTDKDADVAMPLKDLGIDCDKEFADQFDFTRKTASDSDGVQRGSTWQCCPGLLVYRRDIAKDVFGTDDPEAIGEKTKDWDTLKATAAELKAKGYYTLSSYADTFRLYGNSIDNSWVQPGADEVVVDKKITNWVDDSKSGLMQDMLMLKLKASLMMTGTKQWVLSQRYLHSFSQHGESISHLHQTGMEQKDHGLLQHHHRSTTGADLTSTQQQEQITLSMLRISSLL